MTQCHCAALAVEVERLTGEIEKATVDAMAMRRRAERAEGERDVARDEVLRFVAGGVTLNGWWCLGCGAGTLDTWNPEGRSVCGKCGRRGP